MGPLHSSGSVTLATLAAVAVSWTEFWSSSGNFTFTIVQVTSFLGARGPSRRPRAAIVIPPGCRHADAALLNLAASVASRAGPRRRVAVPSAYSISHGRIVVRSARSTDLNFAVRLIYPSCECSMARKMYHSLSGRKSKSGVSGLPLGRCTPNAWLTGSNDCMISSVRVAAISGAL